MTQDSSQDALKRSVADLNKLNTTKEIVVQRSDLPLHCPTDESAIWCAHPRVFLAVEDAKNHEIRCPYCGTLYLLKD